MAANGSDRFHFGDYEIDLHTGELWKHGTRVKLAGQPFQILAVLVKRPGQLVTREELRAQLWPGDTFVDFDHGLNAAVNKLRDVLCDSAESAKYVETLPRRGYRLVVPVNGAASETVTAAEVATLSAQSTVAVSHSPVPEAVATSREAPIAVKISSPPRSMPWGYLATAGAVALGFVAALWLWSRGTTHEPLGGEDGAPIRVISLTTLSDRTSQPAFSPDGSRIAFRRDSAESGHAGIWAKEVGGEGLIRLTGDSHDCCPVWSPNGQSVAFSRLTERRRTIYEVRARGGLPRELATTDLIPDHEELDWSPDSKTIAFVARGSSGEPAIFLWYLESRNARQLTAPAVNQQDWGPAFSPDGSRIAFVRGRNVMVMSTDGGEVLQLTTESRRVIGSPTWTADGQFVVYASVDGELPSLRRVPAGGGAVTRIREAGNLAWSPAISRRGFRLACEVMSSARTIEQVELDHSGEQPQPLVTTLNGENSAPDISPDGSRLVFQSDRAGGLDIWVADRDGRNPIQMTALGTAGSPRWSPDGRALVFDADSEPSSAGRKAVFVIDAGGGTPRPLVRDNFNNQAPRWSRDGKWIYFASDRSGDWQIWKIRDWGDAPVQLTRRGGFAAEESADGKYIYYTKHNRESPELWRVPSDGGPESLILPALRPADWAAWTVVETGILFVELGPNREPTVNSYDLSKGAVRQLIVLDKPPFGITASRGGKRMIFDQPAQAQSHVMLLENFH